MTKKTPDAVLPHEKKKKKRPRGRVPAEISAQRQRIAVEMRYIHGMTFTEITKKLNEMFPKYPLTSEHQAVEYMIKEAEKKYIEEHKAEVERIKAEAAMSLDFVRREAAEAWVTSQDLLKVIKKKQDQTVEQILKAQTGDAAFLKLIKESAIEKAKLFGAVAPTNHKVEHGGKVDIESKVVVYMPSNGRDD